MAAVFALTPAVAIQGVIDYSTSEGRKIYSTATAKLDEELYDCTPKELHHSFSRSSYEQRTLDGTIKLEGFSKSQWTPWIP
jgi:hypothetical protein